VIAFSPGIVQGCIDLLSIASRNALTFPQISSSFARLGGLPSKQVISTAQSLNWLRASEGGIASITPPGSRLLMLVGYQPMLRQALLDYIEVERPAWIQNAPYGRMKVIAFAGTEIAQVFIEAGLAHGNDNETVSFWDVMAAMARGQKNDRLTSIGRQGERLTITHEEKRTGRKPKWVAIDNNEDGYDVLSTVDAGDARSLSIEVKTSTMGAAALCYLTRNEWDRAQETANHVFHFWDMRTNRDPCLAVISPGEMQAHIPSDLGMGSWKIVEIPFAAFRTRFNGLSG
jgi:hypothetical protein